MLGSYWSPDSSAPKRMPTVSNVCPTSDRITVKGRPAVVKLTGQLMSVLAAPRNCGNGARKLNKLRYYCRGLESKLPNQSIMFTPNVQASLEWICNNYSVATPNECDRWATDEVKVEVALDNFSCECLLSLTKLIIIPLCIDIVRIRCVYYYEIDLRFLLCT